MDDQLYVIFDNQGQAIQMAIIANLYYGYPARGKNRRGKPKGAPSMGRGWTHKYGRILEHPTLNLWAHIAIDPDNEGGDLGKISAQQIQMLKDWFAIATTLDSSWFPE
jgi:hypothetical protein